MIKMLNQLMHEQQRAAQAQLQSTGEAALRHSHDPGEEMTWVTYDKALDRAGPEPASVPPLPALKNRSKRTASLY